MAPSSPASKSLSRRAVLQAAAATGLGMWIKPGHTAEPPGGLHLAFGEDPRTGMTVSWSTPGPVSGVRLDLGRGRDWHRVHDIETVAVKGTPTLYHHARLRGLDPSSDYAYRLSHRGASSPARRFTTAPERPARFRFTAFGDQGISSAAAAMAGAVVRAAPAFHLVAGDLCYAGGLDSDAPPDQRAWDSWFRMNSASAARGVPWLPVVGNHEMEAGQGDQGYNGVTARFALPESGVVGAPLTWTFRYGNCAFVGLDGNDASHELPRNRGWMTSAQDVWLERTLARWDADASIDFIVVTFHNCMYSSNAVHGSDAGPRERWEPLFDRFGVALVINGHNHCYERTHPLRGGAPTRSAPPGSRVWPRREGTTYVTAGGGGQDGLPAQAWPAAYVVHEGGVRIPEVAFWSASRTLEQCLLVMDVSTRAPSRLPALRVRAVTLRGAVFDDVVLER